METLMSETKEFKEISATVADLRIDAVAAVGYGVSRSRMVDEIKADNIFINGQVAKKPSQTVKEKDEIKFGARPKVVVAEVRGTTKKGRIGVTLWRFI